MTIESTPAAPSVKTHDNATHYLRCRHAIGRNGKTYLMRCHVLKEMADGRLKLLVFGRRNWKGHENLSNVRYVEPHRVRARLEYP